MTQGMLNPQIDEHAVCKRKDGHEHKNVGHKGERKRMGGDKVARGCNSERLGSTSSNDND